MKKSNPKQSNKNAKKSKTVESSKAKTSLVKNKILAADKNSSAKAFPVKTKATKSGVVKVGAVKNGVVKKAMAAVGTVKSAVAATGAAKTEPAKKVLVKDVKVSVSNVTKAATIVKKVVQNNIDASLLKLSPNMQKTLDSIVSKIEQTPVHIQSLQALACRVLQHANEINENLKQKIATTSAKIKAQ